ncbi:hypothetical protein SK128_002958 [Halocaridina rubra]|uniref:AMP-dependent synthetase/ligase domain-containing protein n=1 Tax=Halocaridina rubra TaxID=373956 RepID=A0AAN8X9G3_HALRR
MQKIWGMESHPTIAILSPNCPEYPMVYFGSIAVGATVTTINAAYTPAEIANHLLDSEADMLVVDSILEPAVDAALQIIQKNMLVVVNGASKKGRPNLQDIIKDTNIPFGKETEFNPDCIATLPYSSGTTGKPKGVSISQSAINGTMGIYHFPEARSIEKAEGDHQDIIMGLLPFFHIYGMMTIMASGLTLGTKIVTLPRFDPRTYASMLREKKMTMLHTVPPLLQFIASSPAVTRKDLSHVHSVMCGAAAVPPVSAMALKEKAGHPIFFQEGE